MISKDRINVQIIDELWVGLLDQGQWLPIRLERKKKNHGGSVQVVDELWIRVTIPSTMNWKIYGLYIYIYIYIFFLERLFCTINPVI